MNIDERTWKGKHKLVILRSIRKFVAGLIVNETELSVKKNNLEKFIEAIEVVKPLMKTRTEKKKDSETADVKPVMEMTVENKKDAKAANITTSSQDDIQIIEGEKDTILKNLNILKKDFIISGKVGDTTNEKDVGYLGIVRQMREGQEKGYKESEIVAAVLKSITPKSLRTYLGMIKNLKITHLSQVLRIHYHEKSATELYQELITMKQQKKEDTTAFVVRAMETREKILFASKEEDEVAYDETQAQKLFLSTIESGINEEVATIIRPSLRPEMDDIELLNEVNRAQGSLKLRLQKSEVSNTKGKPTAAVGAIASETTEDSEILKTLKQLQVKMNSVDTLTKDFQKLSKDVSDMKAKKNIHFELLQN